MNTYLGLLFFVLASIFCGGLIGGLSGLLLTAMNNLILTPYFNAATGNYKWWMLFLAQVGSIGFGLISFIWGSFMTYKKMSGGD